MAETLYLLDGTAFAYRAYFAIPNLSTSAGQPVNAVYGFARNLLKVLREHAPSHIAAVFDAPGKTFRDSLYEQYKATRPPMPEDLASQLSLIDELLEVFGIPVLRAPDVEADDVIGTLARQAAAEGMEVAIVTGDKDMLQLVTNGIRVYDPFKGSAGMWYGPAEVEERYGVPPNRVIDAMALIGDTADNVPGIKGIGEKTARTLLQKYGNLEGLFAHLGELKGKQKERLEAGQDDAYLSRRLVTIDTDVAVDWSLDACKARGMDETKAARFFKQMEFHTLAEELLPEAETKERLDYRLILTEEALEAAIARIRETGAVAVDTETTHTSPMLASLVGVSMSVEEGTGWYLPVGHTPEAMLAPDEESGGEPRRVEGLSKEKALAMLRPVLEDERVGKIGHNLKYDLIVLRRQGIDLPSIAMDTMIASYLTDPSRVRHNLNEVSLHYLKRKLIPISSVIGKGSKAVTFDKVPLDQALDYACEDADIAWRLNKLFAPAMRDRGVEELCHSVELPLLRVLADMEMAGVAIDETVFADLHKELRTRLDALESSIHGHAGEPFQINSPKQLQEILFGKLGLKPIRKTKTGYSTDVEVLEELAREHPLPELLLEYRMLDKLRSTYVEALPKLVHPETGRIHTSFNQAVAATGRLSSSDPNLQNIPVRTEFGRRIRKGFVPGHPERRFVSADYSQIELRVMAHLSGDQRLKEAFAQQADIHRDTAARVFKVEASAVTADMRRQAKAVNFGVMYGISAYGLARNLRISASEANQFIAQYFEEYPGVREWIETTVERGKTDGYVTTLLGRRRYVPELTSGNRNVQAGAERAAINTPVQGSAADLIKLAMLRLHQPLKERFGARMLVQVHDELLVDCPPDQSESVAEYMKDVMENVTELDVPLEAQTGTGADWEAVH